MGFEAGELKVFNPNKEISKEITLEILIRHRDALKQARTGELLGIDISKLGDNQRKINQVKALNLIISAQREMITISRPIIYFRSYQKWKKKRKTDEEKEEFKFEEDGNDYNLLKNWLNFLQNCFNEIIKAERTKSRKDDFIISRNTQDGETLELTENFNEMLGDLESSYEQIYLLMLTNKIVSAGIEEDEELTYKEQEELFIKRVEES